MLGYRSTERRGLPLPAALLAALLLVALGVGTVSALGGEAGPGASPGIGIETLTNGQDADTPPGPFVTVGGPVTWTYVVTNYGSVALTNVAVSDDRGVAVTAPKTALQPGESMTATASGLAVAGQYANVGTVTAELPDGTPVTASDPSHYFGFPFGPPVADFTANTTDGPAPLAVAFADASTGSPTLWAWEFGDDGTSTEQHPVHVYTAPGNYTVNLTVTSPSGSDSETKGLYVRVIQAAPAIDLALAVSADNGTTWHDAETAPGPSLPSTGPAFQFRFVVTNVGNVLLTDCAIGGVAAIGPLEPGMSFTVQQNGTWAAGQQAVSATAYGYHGARAFMAPDTVYYVGVAPPVANFEANATVGPAPFAVEFTDTSTGDGNRTRLWEFGDGETSTAERPVHVYTAPGNYTVNLTVTGVGGPDGETKPDYITVLQDLPPIGGSKAYFLVSTAPAGAEIYLEAGDGTRFLKGDTGAGPLNVTLFLTAVPMRRIVANLTGYHDAVFEIAQYPAAGETVPVDLALEPIAPPAPVANFTANATDGPAPFAVKFTDTSAGDGIAAWAWELGDGGTSSEQHPIHVYTAPGTYAVNLTVTGPGGSDSEAKAGFVTVRPLAGASEAYFLVSTEPAGAAIYLEGLGGTRYLQGTTAAGPLNVTLCRTCTPIRRIVAVLPGYLEAAHALEAYPERGETVPVHLVLEPGTGGPFPAPHVPSTVIQAEDFDTGGEGAAYHDAEPRNLGGAYRPAEGVDVETGDGVTNVGWIRSGEYLEYTVDTTIAGYCRLTLRAANPDPARKPVAVYLDGTPVTEVVVGSTGSWTSYAEFGSVEPLPLRAGRHTLTLAFEGVDRLNLDWLLLAAGTAPAGGGRPFPSAHAVPGRVQAEDYDTGGFSDTTPANEGGAYRADAVDVERGGSGYNVGWIRAGEYLQYSVDAAAAGTYAVSFRVANPGGPKQVTVHVNGHGWPLTLPATGSFGAWQTATLPGVPLDAGRNTVRVETGRASSFNLDYLEFSTGPVVTATTPGPAGGASFTAAPATARAGTAVKFAVTPASGKTIRSAWWSFDAPAHLNTWNSRATNPTFFYPRAGSFSPLVKLVYTDGSTETVHRADYIRAT